MPLYHPRFSSTLQLSTHFHSCYRHISDGTGGISDLSTSFTSIPHQALLDRHCTHITWKFGMSLEALQETTHQNSAIPQIPRTTSISLNTTAHHISVGVIQYTGHIQIRQTYYHICSQPAQLQPTTAHITMQKKPVTLPRNCTQLAHRNSHNQRYMQHQD